MKNQLSEMKSLDIYLSTLAEADREKALSKLKPSNIKTPPLVNWGIFRHYYFKYCEDLRIEKDIEMVKLFAKKNNWQNDIDGVFKNEDFEAIILTDLEQKIIWVNKGFTQMTGYTKNYAINRTPQFLQGTDTSVATKIKIRKQLDDFNSFSEVITNYKKDNSPYKCEVKVIPLHDRKVTHFLALEREII